MLHPWKKAVSGRDTGRLCIRTGDAEKVLPLAGPRLCKETEISLVADRWRGAMAEKICVIGWGKQE